MEDMFGIITLLLIALGIGAVFFWVFGSTVRCAEDLGGMIVRPRGSALVDRAASLQDCAL